MAYEARRDGDLSKEEKAARDNDNNREAAQVGIHAGQNAPGWIGGAFKIASAVDDATNTDGKGGIVSTIAGKGANVGNKFAPGVQALTNAVAKNEKFKDAAKTYASKGKNTADNAKNAAEKAKEGTDKAKEAGAKGRDLGNQMKKGGEQKDSLPSSSEKNNIPNRTGESGQHSGGSQHDNLDEKVTPDENTKKDTKGSGVFGFTVAAPIVIIAIPIILVILFFVIFISVLTNFADYTDAFGISQVAGLDTGGMKGYVSNPDQKEFYERIVEVKNKYQKDGKTIDPLMIVSVYHALNLYDANISYKSMTTGKISKIADAMFSGNVYSESTFKNNLKSSIIPSYLPLANSSTKDSIVKEVFDYIDRYYALIGKKDNSCSSTGSCTYDIDGFYINGSNFKKDVTVNDLYVRLMQCGSYNGHDAGGTWGYPLEGEELIPFEKYILGVAYQEIGPSAPEHAFKAQMIAARSYILARPTQMGSSSSWRKLEKENGKWVLQVASCTADQVYCDPDKGCSAENGDGQWKQVYSGTDHGRMIKGPLAEDSPARKYAAEVQGENLVNNQGYIVLTDYDDTETRKFSELASYGYDYKQIIMQVYSDKYPGAGTLDISKADCGICATAGDFTKWKQYEGDWISIQIGNSGKTIRQIGCLTTSLAIQIAKSGVQTNVSTFNPGTFVEYLNSQSAFSDGGALNDYRYVESVAPNFVYQGYTDVIGMGREEKLNAIRGIVNQTGVYAVAEVKGDTGQHWVAIDSVNGDSINMMDPGSSNTNMWDTYDWYNTSRIVYYKVG